MSANPAKSWLADYQSPLERSKQLQTLERDERVEYRAFGDHMPDAFPMLDIRDKEGNGCLLSYSYLRQVKYALQSSPQVLTLVFSDCLVTLEGVNLRDLLRKIQEHKVEFVQEFNSQRMQKPGEKEAVVMGVEVSFLKEKDSG